jgi:hypothetical protein
LRSALTEVIRERRVKSPAIKPLRRRWLAPSSLSAALVLLPWTVDISGEAPFAHVKLQIAAAESGGSGSGGGGSSGSGGGSDDDGDSSGHGGGGHSGSSGHGHRPDNERVDDRGAAHPSSSKKARRVGRRLEVLYPDGYTETLESGRLILIDPRGRTVVNRQATAQDVARLEALLR